jgi:type IV secretion system protein VirB2
LAVLLVMPEVASAGFFSGSGSGTLPWMKPLGAIASSLSGPVARVGVLIAIAFFGLLMMFGELKGIFGTAARILFGASLALGAVQWAGVLNFGSANSAASYISSGAP